MRKAFKYRIDPSDAQILKMEHTLDLCRELRNAALQERKEAYKLAGKSISFEDQANQLIDIKKDRPEFKGVHSQVLQDALKRMKLAFDHFFRRIAEGAKEPGYPKYHGKYKYNSFTYPQSGYELRGNKIWLSKIGAIPVRFTRPIKGKIKTVTIKRDCDKWFVIFSCDIEDAPQMEQPTVPIKIIGIDVGLEHFLTDSNGKTIENPRNLRHSEAKLAKAQRKLSRKKRFSSHWKKAKRQTAKIHSKIANQRKDFAHKQSRKLIDQYDAICFENLTITNMVKNSKLAKSILDASWSMFFHMLKYKAEEANKLVVNVTPNGTSQECSGCHKKVVKGLSVRFHKCPFCGLILHRDINAAINILARGISVLLAAGLVVTVPGGLALAEPMKGEPWGIPVHMLPSSLVSQTVVSN